MQPLKILNIALFALIITIVLQLFFPKPPQTTIADGVYISAKSDAVTIPNIPQISIHNVSSGAITINPCQDVSISINSSPVKNIKKEFPEFCEPLTLENHTIKTLNLRPLYKIFANYSGKYVLKIDTSFGERYLPFSVEKPGFFRTFLSIVIYEPIYNLFVAILTFLPGHELGWAIVIVTIIIRLLLLFPQHKMLKNTQKMAELGPKMKALQKEYADDRAQLGMKMMELYKKEGVNPMGSCLPLLLQIPILIGLYWVISGISDTSNFYHLYSFFKDFNPHTIQTEFFGQNLLHVGGVVGLFTAIILGLTQWTQSYLSIKNQPKMSSKKDEKKERKDNKMPSFDPQMMQKMTLYIFPMMIAMSGYLFPLGLGLYWWIGLLFMIVQQWYVNSQAKKKKKKGEIIIVKK